jgi:FkbM family methyltransferase
MGIIKNTFDMLFIEHCSIVKVFNYFTGAVKRQMITIPAFRKKWVKENIININGAKMPNILYNRSMAAEFLQCFEDIFTIPVFYNDDYDRKIVEKIDEQAKEGPYGYKDGDFDVTVKRGDIVVNAGAWIGDFSAYAASKGAISYSFEPVKSNFELLKQTALLNEGKIIPVQKALGNSEGKIDIALNSAGSSLIIGKHANKHATIDITTLDKFVEENNIEAIDFIKADIEGAERDMLRGATKVLKRFAPKLAICTYHLPDDPQVLEQIIKEANSNYTVVHLKHKLFAAVVERS